jgi:hypothetical protein
MSLLYSDPGHVLHSDYWVCTALFWKVTTGYVLHCDPVRQVDQGLHVQTPRAKYLVAGWALDQGPLCRSDIPTQEFRNPTDNLLQTPF